jgi:4'-phosphopantetheinyl transferase
MTYWRPFPRPKRHPLVFERFDALAQAASTYSVQLVENIDDEGGSCRPLGPTEVVVALTRPDESDERLSMFMPLLSEDERQRLARFKFERDRRLFLMAHALLRVTLSRYANVEPCAWQFRAGSYGRPEIAHPPSRLRFSLSHTPGLAACAIILDREIGLDVEDTSRGAPIDVAERFFSPMEARQVHSAPLKARATRLFQYWTLKEAYIKARGMGLSLPLDRFTMYEDAEDTWRITFEPPLNDDPGRWQFWSSSVTDNHQAALAITVR